MPRLVVATSSLWQRVASHIHHSNTPPRARQTLRSRLLLIVLPALLPMLAVVMFDGYFNARNLQAASAVRRHARAQIVAEDIDAQMQLVLKTLAPLAGQDDLDALHPPASMQMKLDQVVASVGGFLSLHGADGALVLRAADRETAPTAVMRELRSAALRTQAPVIGGVVFTEPSHLAVVPIVVPGGRSQANRFSIEMLLPGEQLGDTLRRHSLGPTSSADLRDSEGRLIAQGMGTSTQIGAIPPRPAGKPSSRTVTVDLTHIPGWHVTITRRAEVVSAQPFLRAVLGSILAVGIGIALTIRFSHRLTTLLDHLSHMSRNVATGVDVAQSQPEHLPLAEFEVLRRNLARADAVLRRRGAAERMALREARSGHELLVSVVNGTPEQIHVKDLEMRYVLVNRAALSAAPAPLAEWQVLGKQTADIFAPELAARIEEADRKVLATGETSSFEQEYLNPGQTSPRWIAMTIAPWQDAEGRVVGVVSVSRDVTEHRQAEVRLHKLQAELLRATRLSAMGAMASGLAHELNQPLAAATNYLNAGNRLLARGEAGDERALLAARGAVTDAAQQTLRAGAIVRRLRDFVDRGEVEMQPENVAALLRETCDLAQSDGLPDNILLEISVAPSVGPVLVDRTQLGQVLLNLLRNAAEAIQGSDTPTHPGRILMSADLAPGGVVIEVRDNGPGLAAGIAERLFEPFVSSKRAGMGIGLAICRTIVEGHGGKLTATASADGGMIFRILLPVLLPQGEIA